MADQGSSGGILVATRDEVLRLPEDEASFEAVTGLGGHNPTCLAAVAGNGGPAWCGTLEGGVFRSDDGGRSWYPAGLDEAHVMALTVDPVQPDVLWAGTEPSAVWRGTWEPSGEGAFVESELADSGDGARYRGGPGDGTSVRWERREGLLALPSSDDWSFPPRPETHHVRWIACHPSRPGRLWVAVEAGALIWTEDGGATWHDRVDGSPHDTHELAIYPERPDVLRIAAGDGYFESDDGGRSWRSPTDGLDVGYLRSVAVDPRDPDVVVVSAASKARSAYAAFRADGRLYRRREGGPWERVRVGWPDPPDTIAPLLLADPVERRLLAADERGVHASIDGGSRWEPLAAFDEEPAWLRGIAVV